MRASMGSSPGADGNTNGDESGGHLVEVDAVLFALGRTPTLDAKTQERCDSPLAERSLKSMNRYRRTTQYLWRRGCDRPDSTDAPHAHVDGCSQRAVRRCLRAESRFLRYAELYLHFARVARVGATREVLQKRAEHLRSLGSS